MRSDACSITINMYRTTSTIMINGRDATDVLMSNVQESTDNEKIKAANKTIKNAIQNHQPTTKEELPTLPHSNSKFSDNLNLRTMTLNAKDETELCKCPICDQYVPTNGVQCGIWDIW